MAVYSSNNKATLKDVIEILGDAKKRFPVMHLSPFDKIVDGEGYIMSRQIDGTYSFKPNITRQGVLFRGKSHYPEQPNNSAEYEGLQKRFIQLIESFPLYQLFKEGVELPDGKIIRFQNPYALAYAYGVPSPFIGLSSDLDVASFFAISKWNVEEQRYDMVTSGEGVLSSYELRQPLNQMRSLTPLSLQIFRRTYQQKAYVQQMYNYGDFYNLHAVTGFKFTHDPLISQEIFDKFKGGELLAPSDDFLWKKWKLIRSDNNDNCCFSKDDLVEVYRDIHGYWKEFVDLINFTDRESETKDFLMNLSGEKPYSKYFELDRYWNER